MLWFPAGTYNFARLTRARGRLFLGIRNLTLAAEDDAAGNCVVLTGGIGDGRVYVSLSIGLADPPESTDR